VSAVLAIGIAFGVSFALLSGSSRPTLPGGARQGSAGHGFFGTLALPARPAPPIRLRNYLGQPVTLSRYRGNPVLVTFLYTHCPDVCPLIAANLRVALGRLGSWARRTRVIAVSVDPRGDTPASVASFLRAHELVGRMQYLIGSPAQLAGTWRAWGVGSQRQVGEPDRVAHSALVYGIGASGRLLTVYPAGFAPSQIVHDIPRLAAS
jgi:protein SCO1/2